MTRYTPTHAKTGRCVARNRSNKRVGFAWGNGPMWDSVCVTVPYYIYKYDGKTDVLRENADMIYRYLEYISSKRDENGLVAIGLCDWSQPRKRGERISAPLILTDSVTVYDIAVKSAFIFNIIAQTDRAEKAKKLAAEMKDSIRKHLRDYTSLTALGNCQTSQASPPHFAIFEMYETKNTYKRLKEFIAQKDDHAYCGMIGLRYIFELLANSGDIDLALKMICREDEPSYGSMIRRGAMGLCEITMENGLNESENHHFLGDIVRIFHNFIAGLRVNPNMTDINEIIFAPIIPSTLEYANGSFEFKKGTCEFGWERKDGSVIANIAVPKNVHGYFIYGNKKLALKEGINTFCL